MNPTVALGQAVVLGLLLAALRAVGNAAESIILGGAILVVAGIVALSALRARRRLPASARRDGRQKMWWSAAAVIAPQFALDILGLIDHVGPVYVGAARVGFIHLGTDHPAVLAMVMIAVVVVGLIYVSSLIDWVYVRSHLFGSAGRVCQTSTRGPWRLVTRVRIAHRLAAVLGFIAGVTALVALSANQWIRPLDDVVGGAIGGVAAVVAGYYLARAAPLIALATNPAIYICDVVVLAEEFTVPTNTDWCRYFVLDIGWEGVKLRDVTSWQTATPVWAATPEYAAAADPKPPSHDRMIDIGDIPKLLRRREALQECPGPCRRLTGGCLASGGAGNDRSVTT